MAFKRRRTFKRRVSFKRTRRGRVGKRSFKAKRTKRMPRKPTKSATAAYTVETIQFQDIGLNSGAAYDFNFSIQQFPRATDMQPHFRYYRAAKVTWTYEAQYNMYPPVALSSSATIVANPGDTVPQLFWKMDRLGQAPFRSVSQMQDAGAKPIPLSRKKIISYVPNVRRLDIDPDAFQPTAVAGVSLFQSPDLNQLRFKSAPWIATDNDTKLTDEGGINQANWYGHQAVISQQNASPNGPNVLSRVVCTVHWQFKDPFIDQSPPGLMAPTKIMTKAELASKT